MLDGREGRKICAEEGKEEREKTVDEEEREREKEKGRVIYVFISWRARVRRDSHPRRVDAASMVDGGPVRRGHLPAHGPVIPPSLFLVPFRSPPSLSAAREATGAPHPSRNPFCSRYTTFSRYASRAWWSSRMITRYEFLSARRESRGTSPGLEHVTLAERTLGWTGMDSIGRWRGEGSGQRRRSRGGDLFRWLFSDTDWIERRDYWVGMINSNGFDFLM